ncbi:hypothetical protein [Citrobacter freundii]|uniref:hypothetical protein n=1 Tax=Citrobacter freundii TaxID=546 RepID=UPI00397D7C28
MCLFTKRLEEGQLTGLLLDDGKIAITNLQLAMLLDKRDWCQQETARLYSLTIL